MKKILIYPLLLYAAHLFGTNYAIVETLLVRNDTFVKTHISYNALSQPVLISEFVSEDGLSFQKWKYTEQEFKDNRCVRKSSFVWDTNSWSPLFQTEWIYSGENLDTIIESTGENNLWKPQRRETYVYDANNLCTQITRDTFATQWQSVIRTDLQYDNDVLRAIITAKKEQGAWQSCHKIVLDNSSDTCTLYTYDTDWVPHFKSVSIHTNLGRTKETQYAFADNQWQESARKTTNNDGTTVDVMLQTWNMEYWDNVKRETTVANDDGSVITHYSPIYDQWLATDYIETTNNIHGLPEEIIAEALFWGNDYGTTHEDFLPTPSHNWVWGHQLTISYQNLTTYNSINDDLHSIIVYPNPSTTGIFYMDTTLPTPENAQIFNSQGMLLKKCVNLQSRIIDLSDLSDGIYLARIVVADNAYTVKLYKSTN